MNPNARVTTLDEVADIQSGFAFPSKEYSETGHFLVRIGNVQNGEINMNNPRFVELEKHTKKFELHPGDFLTSLTGNIGRVARINETHLPAALNQRVARLRITSTQVLPDYVGYFLQSGSFGERLRQKSHGAAQANVSPKEIASIPVVLPSLEEQKRIVAVLDQAFAALDRARAHAETNLANAKELLEIEMIRTFNYLDGDDVHPISSMFSTATGATPPKSDNLLYGEDIPFVKPPELLNNVVGETKDGLSEAARHRARLAPEGAVLVSCIGNLGKVGLLEREAAFNQQINVIFPDADIARPDFIYWQCRSGPFRNQLEARSSGTTIPIVNKKQFNSIPIWIPNLEEQGRVSRRLTETEQNSIRLQNLYLEKLKNVDDLRQSLLQKAFSGQLT